jgi:hypothetical protein
MKSLLRTLVAEQRFVLSVQEHQEQRVVNQERTLELTIYGWGACYSMSHLSQLRIQILEDHKVADGGYFGSTLPNIFNVDRHISQEPER